MTIHSDWGKLFYEECPEAFTGSLPKNIRWKVGVIDGHLQLMCLNSNFISWDKFIQVMYVSPICRLFKLGCPRVVLCFDNYDNVPVYKNITQTKRCKGKDIAVFHERQSLPSIIPSDAMLFLMNRHFKVRLVHFICSKLPSFIDLEIGQELIIDYKSVVVYNHENIHSAPIQLTDFQPMGESDVKFIRYVKSMGNALVHAVDGDYMVIALLYYIKYSISDNNNIFILRQQSMLKQSTTTATMSCNALSKRKRSDDEASGNETKVKNRQAARVKWWVNMQLIFLSLESTGKSVLLKQSRFQLPDTIGNIRNMMETMIFLILLAGTDFSRALPLIGPKRIWDYWPTILGKNQTFLLPLSRRHVDESFLMDDIINSMYKTLWSNHIDTRVLQNTSWEETHSFLVNCTSIAESTRKRLPTKNQLLATIRNIRWLLEYWNKDNGLVLTPLDGTNGFSKDISTSRIMFSDLVNQEYTVK